MDAFEIRGFNPCESLLRHSPQQLRTFIRRMKTLKLNTLIIHYDYGFKRYQDIILEECEKAGIEIILMTFGPRTFLSYSPWKKEWFAKNADGSVFTQRLECETYPCAYEPEALDAFAYGAKQWLLSLPKQIRHVHMRAADGLMFCQCDKCRTLPDHEKWQPFVEAFVSAVQQTRPDLKYETDVYVKRYNIPQNAAVFGDMTQIMYDTFYRDTKYPIGTHFEPYDPVVVQCAATEPNPDATTANEYHMNRLREWTSRFPGKVYIHENAMAQSLYGTFQHATGTYLKDLENYRKMGIKGICFEAYEPGYAGFADMFELLARVMNGEEVEYSPSKLEQDMKRTPMSLFCNHPDFPIEKYIEDPIYLKQAQLYRKQHLQLTADVFREYLEFSFEYEDLFDPLFIGYGIATTGRIFHKLKFSNLSDGAQDMLHRRKLWDFMEDIPMDQDPRAICKKLLWELHDKAEDWDG